MKVIIAGDRHFTDQQKVNQVIADSEFEISQVISGGAKGVDGLGEHWVEDNGVDLEIFSANWKEYGRAAGPIRNEQMANYADALIAIYDSRTSRGTPNMIEQAKKQGLPMYIYDLYLDLAVYRTEAIKLPIRGYNESNSAITE